MSKIYFMKKGLIIIISGPSGVGKGTIRKQIMKDLSLNLWYSVSMTTRSMRPGEVNGKDYYFVSEEEFNRNIENGNLLEHATFVGHQYGTPLDKLQAMREEGKNVILEIDVNGTEQVLKKLAKECPVTFFIMPPNFACLESRIRGRSTENEEVIQQRLAKASREMELKSQYEYVIYNDDVTRAAIEIENIIRAEIRARDKKTVL
mgnify:CR=1 FL=1